MTPLDLDLWELEAKELIAKLKWMQIKFKHSDEAIDANSVESKRILTLIFELRNLSLKYDLVNQTLDLTTDAEEKLEKRLQVLENENVRLTERNKWAEERLQSADTSKRVKPE